MIDGWVKFKFEAKNYIVQVSRTSDIDEINNITPIHILAKNDSDHKSQTANCDHAQ